MPVVEPARPVAQRLRVVGREALDVVDRRARSSRTPTTMRERCSGAASGNTKRSENGAGLRVAVAQARDAVVEQHPAGLQRVGDVRCA